MNTVNEKVEQLKMSLEQMISDFRTETGVFPHITISEKQVGPCATDIKVNIHVEKELSHLLV